MTIFISHASDFLTDCKPHGDGLIADRFVRHLAARGHRIHVAVNRQELQQPYPANVILHPVATGPRASGLAARFRFAFGVRRLLKQIAATERVDVVHQLNPVVTGLSLALAGVGIPLVLGPYVPDWPLIVYDGKLQKPRWPDRLKSFGKRQVWQLQHRLADGIILSTPAAAEKMRDPSAWARKSHVIPYGIDTSVFTPGPFPAQKTILFVGLIMHHKGVFVLLEAFRAVLERVPDCRLVLAGVGSEMEAAKREAALLPEGSVTFLGHVQRNTLPELLRSCTVSCVPSFGEAFGLVALEAMATGRPIVGTDASGLAYLIDEQGGRKVPVGDASALAAGLIEILSDADLARSMGAANRQRAEQQYSWPAVIQQLERVYRSAMGLAAAHQEEEAA